MPKTDPEAFPWDAAMAFGFGVLKLNSHDFWSMTPLELAAAMRAHGHNDNNSIERSVLDALMSQFPDLN